MICIGDCPYCKGIACFVCGANFVFEACTHRILARHPFDAQPGRKDDFGKQRYDLIPFAALAQVVAVLTKGAEKYAPENWRRVDGWRWRYLGAALRHVVAFMRGEKNDPEWGLPHLAHAICCLMFALELDK